MTGHCNPFMSRYCAVCVLCVFQCSCSSYYLDILICYSFAHRFCRIWKLHVVCSGSTMKLTIHDSRLSNTFSLRQVRQVCICPLTNQDTDTWKLIEIMCFSLETAFHFPTHTWPWPGLPQFYLKGFVPKHCKIKKEVWSCTWFLANVFLKNI